MEKLLLGLGAMSSTIAPITMAIACGNDVSQQKGYEIGAEFQTMDAFIAKLHELNDNNAFLQFKPEVDSEGNFSRYVVSKINNSQITSEWVKGKVDRDISIFIKDKNIDFKDSGVLKVFTLNINWAGTLQNQSEYEITLDDTYYKQRESIGASDNAMALSKIEVEGKTYFTTPIELDLDTYDQRHQAFNEIVRQIKAL